MVLEIYNYESIECLINSIPVKKLISEHGIQYVKMELIDNNFLNNYEIKVLPSLLFFQAGVFLGKIEGYYDNSKEMLLLKAIDNILARKQEQAGGVCP